MVIFLYRPEYYGITTDENGMPINGLAEVIIAKHRNGKTDTVPLKFIGKYTKFTDWAGDTGGSPGSFPRSSGDNTDFTITLPSKGNKSEEDSPF